MIGINDFYDIYKAAKNGQTGTLSFSCNGKEYTRVFRPKERLLLLGGGHICQPLCDFSSELDFQVTVADDRPSFANELRFPKAAQVICDTFPNSIEKFNIGEGDYVCVVTRGHRWDAVCLRNILKGKMPKYLGMIGSKRRVIELLNMLEEEGFSREDLDKIHTPIGVSIGALTTKEISISILAELIACRRESTSRRSKNSVLVTENIDMELLRFICDESKKKTVLIVTESEGSTPVKSGAIMAVDETYHTAGTIGGGCSESAAMLHASRMIGTGNEEEFLVDMSNDVAEEEGMVCGGKMKVAIIDIV